MNIDSLSSEEKRALLGRLLENPSSAPVSFEDHRAFKALQSRLSVVGRWAKTHPFFKVHEGTNRATTRIGGRELLDFSTYNYLGLSGEPRVSEAAKAAVDRYGTSTSASRIASGEKSLHRELESEIARWLQTEEALVFVSGYVTNMATVGHLFGRNDLILADALAHNSVLQGALLSGARVRLFRHNDYEHLDALLREHRSDVEHALIVTEGVFSMDGDIPSLPHLIDLKVRHRAFLMVDEAHSLGVLGKNGGGLREHFGVDANAVDIWMGTLSKSLASCGGYIAGRRELIEYLKYTSPGFLYSVGLPPSNAAASLEALRILEAEPERVARLRANASLFLSEAQRVGLDTHRSSGSAVIPIITGSSFRAIRLGELLFHRGINVDPVISPAVEQDKARLRFFLTASHTEEQIRETVRAIVEEIQKLPSRTTIGGEILATLPSRDRSDLPSGKITDPGISYRGRSRLINPVTGQPERHFDPAKEDANGNLVRGLYRSVAGGTTLDASLFAHSLSVEVAGPPQQSAIGRWRGREAFFEYARHQAKVRPTKNWTVDYVMPHGDRVIVSGVRESQNGKEPYLHWLTVVEGQIVRIEDILDGDAFHGEGPHGPDAERVIIAHESETARRNVQLMGDLYDTFVRKSDIDRFVQACAADVAWEVQGPEQLPFAGTWRGPDGVLLFWQEIASIMDIHEVWIDATIARGDTVYALGGFRSTAIPTALAYSDPFLQVATYAGGKLCRFVDYFDPRIDLAAYRPDLREH